jgi:hypothetical protein
MARDLSREVKNFQHRRAFADDAVKFQVFQELLFERVHAAPLVVQRGHLIQRAFQAVAIDGFGKKVGGAAANGFQGGIEGVFAGDDDDVQAGIGAQGAVQELVALGAGGVDVGNHQAAAATAHRRQGFVGIGRGDRLVAQFGDQGRQPVQLHRIVFEQAGREGTF